LAGPTGRKITSGHRAHKINGFASYMDGKELVILLEKLILQGGNFFKKLLPLLLELEKALLQFTIFVARFIYNIVEREGAQYAMYILRMRT
jgi:hypothetical protein